MYAAYGFKFATEVEACRYLGIEYSDFITWRKTNTGGWTEVEQYPKDSMVELSLNTYLVDPYPTRQCTECTTEEDVQHISMNTAVNWFEDYSLVIITIVSIIVSIAIGISIYSATVVLGNSLESKAPVNKDYYKFSDGYLVSEYDARFINGDQVIDAIALYSCADSGPTVTVDNLMFTNDNK